MPSGMGRRERFPDLQRIFNSLIMASRFVQSVPQISPFMPIGVCILQNSYITTPSLSVIMLLIPSLPTPNGGPRVGATAQLLTCDLTTASPRFPQAHGCVVCVTRKIICG